MEQREKVMLIGLIIAALVVGYYYVIGPGWEEYVERGEEIEQNVERIREAQARARGLEELIEEFEEIQKQLLEAQRRLPEGGEFLELIVALEREAEASGISSGNIITFDEGPIEERGEVVSMGIIAVFENITIGELSQMLWRFNEMERLIDIIEIEITPSDEQDTYDVSLELAAYMLEEEAEEELD